MTAAEKRLNALAGCWRMRTRMYATPFSQAGESQAVARCGWAAHGHIFICDLWSASRQADGKAARKNKHPDTLAIWTYDAKKKVYWYAEIPAGSPGFSGTRMRIQRRKWIYGPSRIELHGETVWVRNVNRFLTLGHIQATVEYSRDRRHWRRMSRTEEWRQ